MEDFPQGFPALCLLAFVLGMKHGLDPDHLATIDGLTRFNASDKPSLAKRCGMLFSLGHGSVVIMIAISVSLFAQSWVVPEWLELTGVWISIGFLAALGWINLHAVLSTPLHTVYAPVGLKGRWLGRLSNTDRPGLIALVGALFALSFDTISQAALFAVTGAHFGGAQHAIILGLLFTLGMLATDGLNGLFIYRLLRRADRQALLSSRIVGMVIGLISLGIACFGAARYIFPPVSHWSEGREMILGLCLTGLVSFTVFLVPKIQHFPRHPER
ncbi:nickel transporter [Denitratisoma oestradiolicum]|uniref:Nickel/cobalt efflux system n=1 Tax=Denitratisoma oestradiolicum TaxID=311182 RepID=A0A6S6XYX5_9PROT|nr:nickel transporter [Denitratisoma oestradiolicum]TWO79157.1 nickel transporter [Denitratisoma oestradiolicum]CAB1369587.1 Nickel/cobalt efflux system [Denitratisoma oestradiolicum]